MPKIIRNNIINRYNDNLLAGYFRSKKTRKMIAQKHH